jgi:hypothetical protein
MNKGHIKMLECFVFTIPSRHSREDHKSVCHVTVCRYGGILLQFPARRYEEKGNGYEYYKREFIETVVYT